MSSLWRKGLSSCLTLFLVGSLLLAPTTTQAQLYDENFESYTDGTTAPGDNSWSVDASAATQDIASVQSPSGDKVFQVQDTDGDVIWETESIDISGSSSASFQVVLNQAGDMETSDYVDVAYSVDGGNFTTITNYDGLGNSNHTLTGNWSETNVTVDGISGNSLTIRVTLNNSANSEDFFLDDVKAFGNTRVQFATSGSTVQEGDSGTTTVNVDVEIQNPSSSSSTSVDVAAVGGSATGGGDDYSFPAQTVTFSAGSSSPKTVSIDVTGDTNTEGPETVDLGLSNPTGGNSATVGTPGQYTLTIDGDDGATVQDGDVFITELMYDPSVSESDGEWIEVHNASNVQVNLRDWTLDEGTVGDGTDIHVVGNSVPVSPGEYVVLCNNPDQSVNGGLYCDYEWSGITLNNTGDTIGLLRPDGTVVDKVGYSGGEASEASLVFTGTAADDNNNQNFRTAATTREPTANLSDPGSPGIRGSDQTTAVRRPMDGVAGWRFVSPSRADLTVQYLADQGFVQGVSGSNPSGDVNVYLRYNPPDGSESSDSKQYWEAAGDVTDALERGRGVLWYLWKQDVPNFLTTTGTIGGISSDQTISGLGDHKWHLLGNPFPNAFRVGDITSSASFASAAQVWVPNQGTYQTVGPGLATEAVGSQVGFFLERTSGVGGGNTASVTFPAGGQALGTETITRKSTRPSGRVSLALIGTNADGDTTTIDRAATLLLHDRAKAGRDRYDATKLTPFSGAFATLSFSAPPGQADTLQRSVASYPFPAKGSRGVALDVVTGGNPDVETLTIWWPSLVLPSGWTALLKDTVTGTEVNLRQQSSYSFSPSGQETAATIAKDTNGADSEGAGPQKGTAAPSPPVPVALSRSLSVSTAKSGTRSSDARFSLSVKRLGAIPVELAAFTAEIDGQNAQLSWRTASETNNSGFYVEHRGGTRPNRFRRLGFVEGKGTTQNPQTYTYRVSGLAPGEHAFRLRQVDTDGTETVTDPVSIRVAPEKALALSAPSPNPARTRTTVSVTTQDERPVTVALFDALGRRVRTIHEGPVPGAKPRSIPVEVRDLASGLYLVRATAGGRTVTRKLTVVR